MKPERLRLAVSSHNEAKVYEFGPFRLDLEIRQLFSGDDPIHLPSKTFDILRILVENSGVVATKDQLIREVWLGESIEESNLTVRMAALRKVLKDSPGNRFIETVSGYGYRFVARVQEVPRGSDTKKSSPSIAILPFSNNTNREQLNYICDGLTEALIASLSHISDLRVMARSTVFRHKHHDVDLLKVGKELNVQTLLVGRVSLGSDQLEIDLEMIDAADGARLWGGKYTRPVDDLVTLQEELAREISEQLRLKLTRSEKKQIAKSHTSNSEAHLLYLKGRYFWNQRSLPGVKKATYYFEKAVSLDPLYALSFAGLADCHAFLAGAEMERPKDAIPKARAAAMQAISLDSHIAEPHVTLGNILSSYDLDWSSAAKEFRLAIQLNPSHAPGYHYYANLLLKHGQFDKALAEIQKAYLLDPLSIVTNLTMGKLYYFARQYDDAVYKGREILEAHPQYGVACGLIGLAYLEMGRVKEAIKEFRLMFRSLAADAQKHREGSEEHANRPDADPEAVSLLGYAYALDGRRSKALELLRKLEGLAQQRYVQAENMALIHLGLGNNDQALALLEKDFEDRVSTLTYLKVWPMFDHVRNHPRYCRLIHRLRLDRNEEY